MEEWLGYEMSVVALGLNPSMEGKVQPGSYISVQVKCRLILTIGQPNLVFLANGSFVDDMHFQEDTPIAIRGTVENVCCFVSKLPVRNHPPQWDMYRLWRS
jgi:hypothetical protein